MKDYSVPIQSLIDHISTATDVDPWAKEMVADLLGCLYEKERRTKVEFIESYIKIGDGEYQWNDNHGELIRCKDCKHRPTYPEAYGAEAIDGKWCYWCELHRAWKHDDWFCADGERGEKCE